MKIENNRLIEVEDSDIVNGTFNIPEEVKAIEHWIFQNCTNLINITIPENIIRIPSGTFLDCINLTNIIIPHSVKFIGGSAFYNCKNLTNITIPHSIRFIGGCAFEDCKKLKSPIANYKAFRINANNELRCREIIFKENEWSKNIDNIELCKKGTIIVLIYLKFLIIMREN